jgi:hypothetical protein
VPAGELDMRLAKPPIKLPEFEISQYWHERVDRHPDNQRLRSLAQYHVRWWGSADKEEIALKLLTP